MFFWDASPSSGLVEQKYVGNFADDLDWFNDATTSGDSVVVSTIAKQNEGNGSLKKVHFAFNTKAVITVIYGPVGFALQKRERMNLKWDPMMQVTWFWKDRHWSILGEAMGW